MKKRNIVVPVVIIALMAAAGIIAAASPLKPTDASYVNAPTIDPAMQPSVTAAPSVTAMPASSTEPVVRPSVTVFPLPQDALSQERVPIDGWAWPCPDCSNVTQPFGMRYHPIKHEYVFCDHISIGANEGTVVLSAIAGKVSKAASDVEQGNYIVISNDSGTATTYRHLKTLQVSAGDKVNAGDTIGTAGSTGNVTGPTLVFSVYVNGQAIDPLSFYRNS